MCGFTGTAGTGMWSGVFNFVGFSVGNFAIYSKLDRRVPVRLPDDFWFRQKERIIFPIESHAPVR